MNLIIEPSAYFSENLLYCSKHDDLSITCFYTAIKADFNDELSEEENIIFFGQNHGLCPIG